MVKFQKIDLFFKRKASNNDENCIASTSTFENHHSGDQTAQPDEQPCKIQKVNMVELDVNCLERDPGKRPQIWEYPVNQRDEVRKAYLNWGPYQYEVEKYPLNGEKNPRRFVASWFKKFPSWLEYSPANDAAYCLPCYLFSKTPSGRPGGDVFTIKGFKAWRKVTGKNCAFLNHIGQSPCSSHNNAFKASLDFQSKHIRNATNVQSSDQITSSLVIQAGECSTSIDIIADSISQGWTNDGHSDRDCSFPSDIDPKWLNFKGEGSSVLFKVPSTGSNLKGMILRIMYSSSQVNIASECDLLSVFMMNYTKTTVHSYKRDTTTSLKDEVWKGLILNLEPGDEVEVVIVLGHRFIVKNTIAHLIYDEVANEKLMECSSVPDKIHI